MTAIATGAPDRSRAGPDISVVICTRDRPQSLHQTLSYLSDADRAGLDVEIVVVDNGSVDDATTDVVRRFDGRLRVRLLREPRQKQFGKTHALNRALDEPGLGEIVAVLDDDMSPHNDWFQGVAAISRRWPDAAVFTGRSYIVWPNGPEPTLARSRELRTWMFSITDNGQEDRPMGNGRWFAGGHFWFRSRCVPADLRFEDIWLTEPKFMLDLVEMGYAAVSGPDAVAGHRIQEGLLSRTAIRRRAINVGRSNADVRLRPYRKTIKHARMLHRHRWLGRAFFCAKLTQACVRWLTGALRWSPDERFVATVTALEQVMYYRQLLRTAGEVPEYRVFARRAHVPAIEPLV